MAIGVDKWIDQQLHPDKIDDSALDARLSPFRTLHMDTREIVENFPPEQMIKAVADGKQSLPSDPLKRAVYQAQLDRYQNKEERKQEAANTNSGKSDRSLTTNAPAASKSASTPTKRPRNSWTCHRTNA